MHCMFQTWLTALVCSVSLSNAFPFSFPDPSALSQDLHSRDVGAFYLRLAPLGASITHGYLSTDGNGYRQGLRNQLRMDGWPVNMVGSLASGTMSDNDNEGHIGLRIEEVAASPLDSVLVYQPNLFLINLGTNDAAQDFDVDNAGTRMIALIDKIYASVPDTTVILSTLIPNKNADTNARVQVINEQFRSQVLSNYNDKKLFLADMNDGFLTTEDLNDDTHPTDAGYQKMAAVFYSAVKYAESVDSITAPVETTYDDAASGYTCSKVYGDGRGNIQIQVGSGTDDGHYTHTSDAQGRVFTFPVTNLQDDEEAGGFDLYGVHFGQLVNAGGNPNRGGEVDEIVYIVDNGDGTYENSFWVNNNDNNFGEQQSFNPNQACPPSNVRFADLNNDGLDEFICLADNGDMSVSINRGGNPPNFEYHGKVIYA